MAYGTEEEPAARVGGARGGLTSRVRMPAVISSGSEALFLTLLTPPHSAHDQYQGSRLRSAGGLIFLSMVAVALLGLSPGGKEPASLQAKLVDLRVHSLATVRSRMP